jgi:glycosyltransferase involved in cell wall biosynthesis
VLAREFAVRARESFRTVFVCLDRLGSLGESLQRNGYRVEVLSRKSGFDDRCARRLARFCRKQNVSLIHAHQYAPFFYSAVGRSLLHPTPILFTEHGRDYPDYRRWKRVLVNRFVLRRRDRVVAVGECVRKALIEYEGISERRVDVVYNGVELERFDHQQTKRDEVRRELGVEAGETVVMQVARLNRLKDQPTALRAMALLVRKHPRTRLILVGDGEDRMAIERLVKELRLAGHVRLLGTCSHVSRLLQGADLLMLSSISEGIPLTLIEAMATGLPCVATRVGGNAEVVADGVTGLLAEPRAPESLAAQLEILCADPALARRMGNAGRQRAVDLFDGHNMHAAYEQIYRTMLGLDPHGQKTNQRESRQDMMVAKA